MGTLVQARDVLTEMRELRAVLRRHRWISVEDKLPEPLNSWKDMFNYVLVYDRRWGVDMARYEKGRWFNRLLCHYEQVTHWMPLPEAPKEEK